MGTWVQHTTTTTIKLALDPRVLLLSHFCSRVATTTIAGRIVRVVNMCA